MRIGIVSPYSFDVPGGVQNHIMDLSEALIGLGHQVSVLAPADEDADLPPYVVPAGPGGAAAVQRVGRPDRVRPGLHRPGPPVAAPRQVRRAARARADDAEPVDAGGALGARAGGRHLPHRDDPLPGAVGRPGPAATGVEKITARIAVSELARKMQVEHLGGGAVEIPNGVAVAKFARRRAAAGLARRRRRARLPGPVHRAAQGLRRCCGRRSCRWPAERPGLRLLVAGPGRPRRPVRRRSPPTCTIG